MKQGLFLICPTAVKADVLARLQKIETADAFLYEGTNNLPDLAAAVQAKNIAFMVLNDPELALKINADGVQIPSCDDIRKIKQSLGDLSLGVVCTSRDEAMRAGEAGADYIAFDGDSAVQLALWWIDLFTLPCLVLNGDCPQADFKVSHLF